MFDTVPSGHAVQLAATVYRPVEELHPGAEYLPFGHELQPAAPLALYFPAGQLLH